ncbi:IS4 family transposase, partial [Bacillus mycoides]
STLFDILSIYKWEEYETSKIKKASVRKLSSYDYFLLFHQALHKNTQELSKILLRLFNLLKRNGRKSHRYEKKTVFDILGVVYEYTTSTHQVA